MMVEITIVYFSASKYFKANYIESPAIIKIFTRLLIKRGIKSHVALHL